MNDLSEREKQESELPPVGAIAVTPAKESNLPTTGEQPEIAGPAVMQVSKEISSIGGKAHHTEFPSLTVEGTGSIQVEDKRLTPQELAGIFGSNESGLWRKMRLAANQTLHRDKR